jgi:dienelactone hydrolase
MLERREFLELIGAAAAAATLKVPSSIGQRPLPKSEFDYVDWSWRRWRTITRETYPRLTGRQTGSAELVYPLDNADKSTIKTSTEWSSRRESITELINSFLGNPPVSKPSLAPRIVEEKDFENYTRRKLTFQSELGDHIPAYLLVPKNLNHRVPAVLCPHQTTIPLTNGMREPAGIAGEPALQTALHLVNRGYVTLSWDALCFGERHDPSRGHYGDAIPFYQKHSRWSLMGKMVWDASRAIDYLETLDNVDSTRIGSVGHSHGGVTTIFSMAFDSRIRVGASNCGFDTFRLDGNTWRWSHATALIPKLGFYVSSPYINMDQYRAFPDSEVIKTPFDMHELLALIAPRPLFLSTSDEDFVFPNAGWSVRQSLTRIEPVYSLLNSSDRLGSYFFKGGHSFPSDASKLCYEWFDRWLKN